MGFNMARIRSSRVDFAFAALLTLQPESCATQIDQIISDYRIVEKLGGSGLFASREAQRRAPCGENVR